MIKEAQKNKRTEEHNRAHRLSTRLKRTFWNLEFGILNLKSPRGAILMLTLIFTSLFVMIFGGLTMLAIIQNKYGLVRVASERSFQIAETGINYYRWHLAHAPNDYTDGTGNPGPYVHTVTDPSAGDLGAFSLEITPPDTCSNAVTITSTGSSVGAYAAPRKLQALYGKPSLARFAFMTNANVWFGEDEELHGPVHSNGGIRQDGENDGIMTSAKETYLCGSEHGCGGQTKPGIWGEGEIAALWQFPVASIDFNQITADLASLKGAATTSGIYFPPIGIGYHLVLRDDGNIDVYQVTELMPAVSQYNGTSWITASYDIKTETLINTYAAPSNCSIIFVEDDVWVEGEWDNRRITIVSAVLPDVPGTNTNIYIDGNILYKSRNEQTSIALIAQNNILVPLYSAPNDLEINAVLLAQKGHVFRNHYTSSHAPYHMRDYLELYGAIISYTTWTWTWVDGSGNPTSGYRSTETIYDPHLKYYPPPGFPTENEYEFIRWEEITEK